MLDVPVLKCLIYVLNLSSLYCTFTLKLIHGNYFTYSIYLFITYFIHVHPCEKVIGIFFRHKFFIIYFLPFVLVFIHDICEVVNINCVNFCWISIIGYASVTF